MNQKNCLTTWKNRKAAAFRCGLFLVGVGIFYGCLFLLGITCPIKWFTGISCAGCGMTRAWFSALQGNFGRAFFYHPLFWAVPIVGLCYMGYKWKKIPERIWRLILTVVLLLFLAVYLVRMFRPDTIVVCHPMESVPVRIFRKIFSLAG